MVLTAFAAYPGAHTSLHSGGRYFFYQACIGSTPLTQTKTTAARRDFCLVRGQGLEPRFLGPEPNVLPLDDPRIFLDDRKRNTSVTYSQTPVNAVYFCYEHQGA